MSWSVWLSLKVSEPAREGESWMREAVPRIATYECIMRWHRPPYERPNEANEDKESQMGVLGLLSVIHKDPQSSKSQENVRQM
jgi:hypothetical protein